MNDGGLLIGQLEISEVGRLQETGFEKSRVLARMVQLMECRGNHPCSEHADRRQLASWWLEPRYEDLSEEAQCRVARFHDLTINVSSV